MATDSKMEMATALPGNTKTGSAKHRAYILTLNEKSLEHYEDIKEYILNLKSNTYYLCCEHIGQENKHYHIYCQFKTPIKLSLKKLFGSHVEYTMGTPQDCIKYLRCEDDKHIKQGVKSIQIDEEGEIRKTGSFKTIREVKQMTQDERLDLPLNYKNIVDKINEEDKEKEMFMDMLTEIENDNLKGPEVIYITGPSGTGKTYQAYKLALKKYNKSDIGKMLINNNFIKITNQDAKCFVIEEFRPSQIHASDFLQLTDKYGFNCNVKGGFISVRPQCLIICSIVPPEELYKNEEINTQFKRRITECFEVDENHELKKYISIDDIKL